MKDKTDAVIEEIEAFDLLSLPLRKTAAKAEGSKDDGKKGKRKTAAPKPKSK